MNQGLPEPDFTLLILPSKTVHRRLSFPRVAFLHRLCRPLLDISRCSAQQTFSVQWLLHSEDSSYRGCFMIQLKPYHFHRFKFPHFSINLFRLFPPYFTSLHLLALTFVRFSSFASLPPPSSLGSTHSRTVQNSVKNLTCFISKWKFKSVKMIGVELNRKSSPYNY